MGAGHTGYSLAYWLSERSGALNACTNIDAKYCVAREKLLFGEARTVLGISKSQALVQ